MTDKHYPLLLPSEIVSGLLRLIRASRHERIVSLRNTLRAISLKLEESFGSMEPIREFLDHLAKPGYEEACVILHALALSGADFLLEVERQLGSIHETN